MTAPPGSLLRGPLLRETEAGWVRGETLKAGHSHSWAWLGVPYAAQAAGPLRFRPPQPHGGWVGIREARSFGPDVLQPLDPSVTLTPSVEGSLLLNIWTPARPAPAGGWPVLFWLHGGAFRAGSGRLYDGRELAARGEIVVVSVNSRLGPLGYANFGGLFADDRFAPNAGFQDQVAALRWVHANIAAFGGNPARITAAGQSAGAAGVSLLLGHGSTAPLLAGAILQSGGLNQVSDLDNSLDIARAYANALGVRRDNLNALWTLPPRAFVAALHTLEGVRKRSLNSRPFLDGVLLPTTRAELLARPLAPVPLLIGANREEYSLFVRLPDRIFQKIDRTYLAHKLEQQASPERVLKILSAYPDTLEGLTALGTDLFFHTPNDVLGDAHPAPHWRYRLDWGTKVAGLGATHGMELLFLWPRPMGLSSALMRGGQARQRAALAHRMQTAWLNFVREGSPGPDWQPGSAEQPNVNVLSLAGLSVEAEAERKRRALWDGLVVPMP
ncbi:carboxylesterase/lipase family protein [Deinococcus puniceus]|uniref:Carboxylesterase type B domain-containing protein n=1 Tax=Deinococcus puniceus TaxID=1182568 RepID=A0A172TAY1_9DEIO|nr:carboxylesterase family protein [Deinococcus puniceus]ANE44151.1 hypothetical protein SU48_10625 [Deinococcus puniceus]